MIVNRSSVVFENRLPTTIEGHCDTEGINHTDSTPQQVRGQSFLRHQSLIDWLINYPLIFHILPGISTHASLNEYICMNANLITSSRPIYIQMTSANKLSTTKPKLKPKLYL